VANSYLCKWFIKKHVDEYTTIPQDFQSRGLENEQFGVV
jgi:hypothetical protein